MAGNRFVCGVFAAGASMLVASSSLADQQATCAKPAYVEQEDIHAPNMIMPDGRQLHYSGRSRFSSGKSTELDAGVEYQDGTWVTFNREYDDREHRYTDRILVKTNGNTRVIAQAATDVSLILFSGALHKDDPKIPQLLAEREALKGEGEKLFAKAILENIGSETSPGCVKQSLLSPEIR
jgi:hypothetical protein